MNIFVDTNVLLDSLVHREKFEENASKVLSLGLLGHNLHVSSLSIANIMYIAHKYDYNAIKETVKGIFDFINVADYKSSIVKSALSLDWKDYEDATQYLTAMDVGCDCIVTRNGKDFKKSSLPVL